MTATVTPPGLTRAGLRVTAGCGVGGDGPEGQIFPDHRPREYGCSVTAEAAYALPGQETARSAVQAAEAAMTQAGCSTSEPASATLSEQDLARLDTDPTASIVQVGYLCDSQRVDVYFGRSDSVAMQEDTDRLSEHGGGTAVREDPRLDLSSLSSALEAREHVTNRFMVVIFSGRSYLSIQECGMRACDTHGEPVIPDTSFPTPQP
ncbi:hypothetical protein W824_07075 [Clavibacter cf. michiganensis LMG 26808]|nr:hypothetical protein W824_07075 [Clavibacter cf. michiganensis LMG 26808]